MRSTGSVAAAALLLVACSATTGDTDPPEDRALVERGTELYAAHCAACHGDDLRGTGTGPSLLSVVYEPNHHPDEAFHLAVTRGARAHHWNFGDMPPIVGLTPEEIDAIIALVRQTQQTEGYEPYPP
ncbi:hypothetical protein BH23ACT5_BH23ACT5_16430 [soil metagenome]